MLVAACGKDSSSSSKSEDAGAIWLNGDFVVMAAEGASNNVFTQMNADFNSGSLRLGLTNDLGYAKVGWKHPKVDLNTLTVKLEEDLVVTRFTLELPYEWKNLLGSTEKRRTFHVDVTLKMEMRIDEGIVITNIKHKSATDLRGGDGDHRRQLNILTKLGDFFGSKSSEKMQEKLTEWFAANGPEAIDLNNPNSGYIKDGNMVYK